MDQQDLHDLNVSENLITRLLAVFKTEVPEPPAKMMSYGYVGVYHALNEFYAMKLVLASGERITVRNVKNLVTGTTAEVAANVKTLRAELPDEFLSPAKDHADDAMMKLKRELVADERAVFEIELAEQDEQHTAELIAIETAHTKALKALETGLAKAQGENASMANLLSAAQTSNEELMDKLKHEAVNAAEFHNAQMLAAERKETLDKTDKIIETLNGNFEHYRKEATERCKAFESSGEYYKTEHQKSEREIQILKQGIERYVKERDELSAQVSELSMKAQQTEMLLDHDHKETLFMDKVTEGLAPLGTLKTMIDDFALASKQKAVDMNVINKSLNDLASNLLSLKNVIEKSQLEQKQHRDKKDDE